LVCDTEIANVGMNIRQVRPLTEANATEPPGVGSDADARPAAAGLHGAPSCAHNAREQESYSILGELAEACGVVSDWRKQARSLGNGTLIETLERMQRELDARLAEERLSLRAK
jgi:hypothetical protein